MRAILPWVASEAKLVASSLAPVLAMKRSISPEIFLGRSLALCRTHILDSFSIDAMAFRWTVIPYEQEVYKLASVIVAEHAVAVFLLLRIPHRLRQDDFLLWLQLQGLDRRGLIDTRPTTERFGNQPKGKTRRKVSKRTLRAEWTVRKKLRVVLVYRKDA